MLPTVNIWEKTTRSLRMLRLDTMRGKFVAFAVLATLFTTLVMTVMLYGRNRRSLSDRVGLELRTLSSDMAREVDVWLDQRVYDLRLRASPYVVSDNLARATGRNAAQSLNRLRDYLNSVRQNLPGHEGLAIIGQDGQVLTSSGSRTGFRLTPDRLNNLRTRDALVGEPFWDAGIGKAALVLVVPIRRDDGLFLGALGAKINLDSLSNMLQQLSPDHSRDLYLITEQGRVIISSAGSPADVMKTTLPETTTRELSEREGQTIVQSRPKGREVVAVLRRISPLPMSAVVQTPPAVTAPGRDGEREVPRVADPLPGLLIRRHLMGTLASEVQRSRRLRRAFAVLLADVDRFKQYNDTHGHLAGDSALVKIAEVFRKTTRQVDCVARYGGEGFVVMLLEANTETATLVAERIRSRVAEQDLGEGNLTLSIGVAEYPDGGDTPEELIATADAAMYKAKNAGRNQVVVAGIEQRPQETIEQRPQEKKPPRRKREA